MRHILGVSHRDFIERIMLWAGFLRAEWPPPTPPKGREVESELLKNAFKLYKKQGYLCFLRRSILREVKLFCNFATDNKIVR